MGKITLFFMLFFNSIAYGQLGIYTEYPDKPFKYDTIKAILLITECNDCNAKSQNGYIIKEGKFGQVYDGRLTLNIQYGYSYYRFGYLNKHKTPFDPKVIVWDGKEIKN